MDTTRWHRVRALFEAVLDRIEDHSAPLEAARKWVHQDASVQEDPRLEDEVMRLLDAHFSEDVDLAAPLTHSALENIWQSGTRDAPDPDRGHDQLDAGQRVDRYRIVKRLGRGGMGTVYLAERDDGHFSQQIALKLVASHHPGSDLPDRFKEERQILAGLNHPNIARLLDGGPSEWGPFLAMEFVDGSPLDHYCTEHACTWKQRLDFFQTVCEAVQYSHSNLVVHRDLKPAHILITAEGRVKLLDFGVAALMDPTTGQSGLQSRATPRYASPEQLAGQPVSTQADVFALGRVLEELMAPVEYPGWLLRDVQRIIDRATRPVPADRYETVSHLAGDIRRAIESRPLISTQIGAVERAHRFLRRNRLTASSAMLVLVVLGAGLWSTWNQARIAEERFAQVRSLSNALLYDLHDSIRDLPGATAARRLLSERAVAYLDTLSATGREDIESELALGYEQVGEIQGNPHYMNLGDLAAAMQSYEHALTIRRRAFERDSTEVAIRLAYAETMGQAAVLTSWNEDNSGAIVMSRRALQILSDTDSSTVSVRRTHVSGRIRSELGWWLIWEGRAAEGLNELTRSTRDLEDLTREYPDADDINLDLWRAYSYQVDGLRFTGRSGEALDLIENKGLPLLQRIRDREPLHPRMLYGLHVAHDYLGVLRTTMGEHEAAAAEHAASLSFAQTLVELDPLNQKAHEAMARTQTARGNVLARLGRTEESLAAFRASNATRERLFEENPLNASLGNTASTGHRALCRSLLGMDLLNEAIESCFRAIDIQQRVVAVSKGSPILIANLGHSYAYMARAMAAQARTLPEPDSLIRQAGHYYEESVTTLESIAAIMEEYVFEIHPDTLRREWDTLTASVR